MLLNTYNNPRLLLTKDEALALAVELLALVQTAERTPSNSATGVFPMLVGAEFNMDEKVKVSKISIYVEENASMA